MENRSFDHMLGWLHKTNPEIVGLTGNETNHYDTRNSSSPFVRVNENGYNVSPDDPGHTWERTAEEIFGHSVIPTKKYVPKMDGFVQTALKMKHSPENPMSMFTIKTAPIINTLAQEFAVFDKWFCSLPGPTDPNRAFAMSGTSQGVITNYNGTLWGQQSYFDFLTDHGVSWGANYQDDPWAIMYFKDMHEAKNHKFVSTLDKFLVNVENGVLPSFTWLQPRMTSHNGAPTWQHPDAPVSEGEKLIKTVYETLRKSKYWNELAFIITYDEHGGFYDHVPPPQDGIPNPDGIDAPNGFTFDRLGIRIPTVVISPWINKGTVVHEPTGPLSTSHYDATSVIATCNKIFGLPNENFKSKRVQWVGTFEDVFTQRTTPRTDCPTNLPAVPSVTDEDLAIQHARPLNDHLELQVQFYCQQNGHPEGCGKDITNQLEASLFISEQVPIFMNKLRSKYD
eukprot:TRINITY_DN9547_c0_g1_i1.p1 TRINITY_DN9547_c0_g1~~TRINITY_DN9547_c0_g1_i1.p1  ORF type:complete len:495 (-),score=135.20 TRINITY_DN9547_c0_g1_i1:72-1427(-)